MIYHPRYEEYYESSREFPYYIHPETKLYAENIVSSVAKPLAQLEAPLYAASFALPLGLAAYRTYDKYQKKQAKKAAEDEMKLRLALEQNKLYSHKQLPWRGTKTPESPRRAAQKRSIIGNLLQGNIRSQNIIPGNNLIRDENLSIDTINEPVVVEDDRGRSRERHPTVESLFPDTTEVKQKKKPKSQELTLGPRPKPGLTITEEDVRRFEKRNKGVKIVDRPIIPKIEPVYENKPKMKPISRDTLQNINKLHNKQPSLEYDFSAVNTPLDSRLYKGSMYPEKEIDVGRRITQEKYYDMLIQNPPIKKPRGRPKKKGNGVIENLMYNKKRFNLI